MSAAITRHAIRIPGRLIASPTNLSVPEPYGGTYLGLTRDAELRFGFKTRLVTAEEFGNTPVESLYIGETVFFAAVLREFDDDMLAKVFPNTATGASSGSKIVKYSPAASSGSTRPGTLLSGNSFKLLFAPKAPESHPAVLIYKAIPLVDEQAILQMALGEEVGLVVGFQGIPDATGRTYVMGKLEDLTL